MIEKPQTIQNYPLNQLKQTKTKNKFKPAEASRSTLD